MLGSGCALHHIHSTAPQTEDCCYHTTWSNCLTRPHFPLSVFLHFLLMTFCTHLRCPPPPNISPLSNFSSHTHFSFVYELWQSEWCGSLQGSDGSVSDEILLGALSMSPRSHSEANGPAPAPRSVWKFRLKITNRLHCTGLYEHNVYSILKEPFYILCTDETEMTQQNRRAPQTHPLSVAAGNSDLSDLAGTSWSLFTSLCMTTSRKQTNTFHKSWGRLESIFHLIQPKWNVQQEKTL